jgi:phosphinothricin acetyltransferase
MVRNADLSDAGRITEIYNYYIEHTVITFVEEKITVEETRQKIDDLLKKSYPYIVYEEEGEVVAYACLSNWRPQSAYGITLETTVYLDAHFTGKGIGTILYKELLERAKTMKIHSLIGVLAVPNEASRRLHEKFGFHLAGIFKETGYKFNRLVDVEFWQYFTQAPSANVGSTLNIKQ